MRRFFFATVAAVLLLGFTGAGSLTMAQTANVFTANNFPLPAAPPDYFLPNANGVAVPVGHTSWNLTFDTTGLAPDQPLAFVAVDYHYTNAQLSGQPFTGWIEDCSAPLTTTHTDKLGNVVFSAFLGCSLNRVLGFYPDFARLHVTSSPGYARIPSATLQLN